MLAGRPAELDRHAQLADRARSTPGWSISTTILALAHQLRAERLVQLQDRLQAAVVLAREGLPLLTGAPPEDLLHLCVRRRAGVLELRRDQLLVADPPAPGRPELRLQRAQRDPAILAFVGPVADQRAGQRQVAAAGHHVLGEVGRRDHGQPGQGAVGHRDVDHLALARARSRRSVAVALAQRREDAEGRHQRTAAEVGDLAGRLHRLSAAGAGQPQQPDQAEVVRVVARGVALGPVLAIAADRAVDEAGVLLAHPLIADAQTVEHAGAEGLEHDVVLAHEAQQRLTAPLALEVQADRALVAVQRQEQRRGGRRVGALVEGGRPADVVAHARVLDLQHVRSEVRQQQRAEAPRQQPREVEHPDPLQREAHAGLPARWGTPSMARASSTVAGRRPTSSVIWRALAISSPFEEAIRPSGR